MAFGDWRSFATSTHLHSVDLHICRETHPGRVEIVDLSPVIVTREVDEATSTPVSANLPMEVAEALYRALHRLFGDSDPNGSLEALKVERARVDTILSHLLKQKETSGN